MLRFLFKSKRNDVSPERRFWIYASGEFLLIFLGILIALQVDNWNQNRQERKLERILLSEMLDNLEQDLYDIDWALNYKRNNVRSNDIVMKYLNGSLPWHDSLEYHFGRLIQSSVFVNNISAYESLKSIGIDLIRNDSLRKHITHIYSARYKYIDAKDKEGLQANFDFLYPTLKQHLKFMPGGRATPLHRESIGQSHILRSDLINYRHLVGLSIGAYEMARKMVIQLMEMIELELD